jgi:nucleotide-binding universal stress UspA family protein
VASPIRKMLVYIDGTEQSITAAQFALCCAKRIEAELTALYVINTRALDDLLKARIFLKEEQAEYTRDLEADAERYLNHVRDLARNKGVAIETVKATGTPNQEIVRVVKEGGFDVLVVGELSRIRSRRDEFYDETERAMRAVPCSVLIVKDEERVWEMYQAL